MGVVLVPPQLPSCHGYAQPGGVRTARMRSNFNAVGAGVPEARRMQDLVFGAAAGKVLTGSGPCGAELSPLSCTNL